jgi:hypothetical protein
MSGINISYLVAIRNGRLVQADEAQVDKNKCSILRLEIRHARRIVLLCKALLYLIQWLLRLVVVNPNAHFISIPHLA